MSGRASVDVVVVGAGIVGACCAYALVRAGLSVTVLDRGGLAGGTTASGEGNLLLSDKLPGPELDLARRSMRHWRALPDRLGEDLGRSADAITAELEFDVKGGLMVTADPAATVALKEFTARQRAAGIRVTPLDGDAARAREPYLSPDVVAAAHFPQDAQVQPVLAAALILAASRRRGATVRTGSAVTGFGTGRGGRITSVRTATATVGTGAVVNAAGPWSAELAALAGTSLAVVPRRGSILVTEPLPPLIRHKVYDAGYLAAVASDDPAMQASAVVESTAAGTVLIGSTRQRVGFERRLRLDVLRTLARNAVALFPKLAGARIMRAYSGFRPYSPDHLPIIGADPVVPNLWHATGHEGAGIGLAPATGELIAQLITGAKPNVDPAPYRADRPTLHATPAMELAAGPADGYPAAGDGDAGTPATGGDGWEAAP